MLVCCSCNCKEKEKIWVEIISSCTSWRETPAQKKNSSLKNVMMWWCDDGVPAWFKNKQDKIHKPMLLLEWNCVISNITNCLLWCWRSKAASVMCLAAGGELERSKAAPVFAATSNCENKNEYQVAFSQIKR